MRLKMTVAAVALLVASTAAGQSMFRVDYLTTRTYGETEMGREVGTWTFAPAGHWRVDREVNGELTTEVLIPGDRPGEGERIEVNHSLGTARRGPLSLMPGQRTVEFERSLTRRRTVLPGSPEHRAAEAALQRGEGVRAEYLGQVGLGPLILHQYRSEFPDGMVINAWRYQMQNGDSLVIERTIEQTAPDGTLAVQQTRVMSAERVAFDEAVFTQSIPRGLPVQDIWERIAPRQQR